MKRRGCNGALLSASLASKAAMTHIEARVPPEATSTTAGARTGRPRTL